jgi:hypothetical protein
MRLINGKEYPDNLQVTNLYGADLRGADLQDADLSSPTLLREMEHFLEPPCPTASQPVRFGIGSAPALCYMP